MSRVSTERFSEIVALSEAMLACAQQSDWLHLADLEIKRRALVATTMQTPDADVIEAYGIAVRRLLALDRRTLDLAQAGQTDLAKQIHALNAGRDAIQAYTRQKPELP